MIKNYNLYNVYTPSLKVSSFYVEAENIIQCFEKAKEHLNDLKKKTIFIDVDEELKLISITKINQLFIR